MTPPTGAGLIDVVRATTRAAAEFVRASRPDGRVAVEATKSSETDPVTLIDRATEDLVRSLVAAARPGDVVLGEEAGEGAPSPAAAGSDVRWVVDPIDGTVNFVYGIPSYAVSIGVEVGGETVAGCVVNVVTGEEYHAVRGAGAYKVEADGTERRLTGPPPTPLALQLVGTGFSYDAATRERQGAAVTALLSHVRDVRRVGSAALDLCSVAAGRVDAYVEQGLKPWDLSAGTLVAREAGCVVTGLDGGEPDERLTVATRADGAADLLALVVRCGF